MKEQSIDDLINIQGFKGKPRPELIETPKKLMCTTCRRPQLFQYSYTLKDEKDLRICDYYVCPECKSDVAQNIVNPEGYIKWIQKS